VDESADQRTYILRPCKNVAAYRTVLLADAEGREALLMLKRFLRGPQTQTAFVFRSKRGTALRETSVLHTILHPVLRTLGLPQAGMHAFRHGGNRRWELSGMNPAVYSANKWVTAGKIYWGNSTRQGARGVLHDGIGKYGCYWKTAELYRQSFSCV
jgi:hypothetical protein